ncbi:unnamed protein product [Caenorhabditis bovis]|uniref:Sterol regulatory element-binding protein cleavage-activating protein n=1 Tax=Caenorhabditis bovis TaxID=2654633 RepID=A0A8S1EQX6_9PELO|nr:unnamed protein product [Caenorhabditis bovis]
MVIKNKLKWVSAREKISNAYHDYGRLCAAHPLACLCMSIATMVVLSYPAVTRLRLPVSTPIDIFWSDHLHVSEKLAPFWINENPASYIQQFIVSATIEPWNASILTPEHTVRAAVATAFRLREIVISEPSVEELCLRLASPSDKTWPFRSKSLCVVLSPASIWYNDLEKFKKDPNSIETIFNEECKSTFCMRDLLLGAPISLTGIKQRYQTNRKRSIEFAMTVFFAKYSKNVINRLKERISKTFEVMPLPLNDESTFVQVYFHPLKSFKDLLPLISTYILCMIYLYYCSRKFEMVASRWGLAFAASFTVAATLLMTTGICAHLDLSTTLWGAEIYPYIALILGLENTLCITRSVVYTPPSLDVSSRIAHGLSQEGYKLTKYFVLELFFLLCGYLTRVSDIQEFCQFSAICIVVDFYMQLFFYAPCLTFDLERLGLEEKRRFAEILFYAEIPRLKNYPPVSCPMRKVCPKLFAMSKVQKRRLSDSGIDEVFSANKKEKSKTYPKLDTVWKDDSELPKADLEGSLRMRILYFITRTRIVQRTIMVVFAVWVIWLAVIVGSGRTAEILSKLNQTDESLSQRHRILSIANLKYGYWQKSTYKWWPAVAHDYNISLNSRYVTFVPPIVLNAKIQPNDDLLKVVEQIKSPSKEALTETPILQNRIEWLETKLKVYLAAFWLLLLCTVASFFVYVFLSDRWKFGVKKVEESATSSKHSDESSTITSSSTKGFVEKLPLVFNGHDFPIETVGLDPDTPRFLSACQEGFVYLWNSFTGERITRLNRLRAVPLNEGETLIKVWAVAIKNDVAFLGCSDGVVEIASLIRNKLIGVYHSNNNSGVSHIACYDEFVTIVRLDGTIDFVQVSVEKQRVHEIKVMNTVCGHQKPICRLVAWRDQFITSSFDRSIKMWNAKTGTMANIFLAHNSPVLNVVVHAEKSLMFSSCEDGLICWWDLVTSELIRSIDNNCVWAFQLSVSSDYLLGFYDSSQLFLWSLETGQLVCRVTDASTNEMSEDTLFTGDSSGIVSFDDGIAATASGDSVTFWDQEHKAIIGKVKLNGKINSTRKLSSNKVLCCVGNTMYAAIVPVVRIK